MEEKIIKAKSGNYGRVQVTLPVTVKDTVLIWAKKSGVNKAAFLRMALMIGAANLAEYINVKDDDELYSAMSLPTGFGGSAPPAGDEDGATRTNP